MGVVKDTGQQMSVLAIDPSSTNTGWCSWNGSRAHHWSTQYKQKLHADRFGQLMSDIQDAIHIHNPSMVAFEIPPLTKSPAAAQVLMGMAGVIQAAAFIAELPSLGVHNKTIKAHGGANKFDRFLKGALSSKDKNKARKARKQAMVDAAKAMGFGVTNDDEADAAILADYVLRNAVFGEAVARAKGKAA